MKRKAHFAEKILNCLRQRRASAKHKQIRKEYFLIDPLYNKAARSVVQRSKRVHDSKAYACKCQFANSMGVCSFHDRSQLDTECIQMTL
ncbi:hypothetical protein WK90_28405 [Burkholderia cepacia]|nr:hypothetical protein WK84_29450 [Burkholderia cepacia]KVV62987.1 hypothetical protein WK83_07975 [Burkholderia cepacia]KVV66264.1 hypothetical protein WK85_27750 [Burkholderia cepacia]KVV71502.1 hypothetical protein WK86_35555 [Burkholderia cepacia]KVV80642.1 hypothetical protein WK87_27710 [Burkholderia cepacia]